MVLFIICCSINALADSYADAYAKAWEAFYIQSGWKGNITNYTTHFEEQYLYDFEKEYVPDFIMKNGGFIYFLGDAAVRQQVNFKWDF